MKNELSLQNRPCYVESGRIVVFRVQLSFCSLDTLIRCVVRLTTDNSLTKNVLNCFTFVQLWVWAVNLEFIIIISKAIIFTNSTFENLLKISTFHLVKVVFL